MIDQDVNFYRAAKEGLQDPRTGIYDVIQDCGHLHSCPETAEVCGIELFGEGCFMLLDQDGREIGDSPEDYPEPSGNEDATLSFDIHDSEGNVLYVKGMTLV